jgi:hypothetical protein
MGYIDSKDPETIKVIVPPNVRIIRDYDTDLVLTSGEEHTIIPRNLRSATLRSAFLQGRIRITQGTAKFPFKGSIVTAIGIPGGNTTVEISSDLGTYTFDLATQKKMAAAPAVKVTQKPPKKK